MKLISLAELETSATIFRNVVEVRKRKNMRNLELNYEFLTHTMHSAII